MSSLTEMTPDSASRSLSVLVTGPRLSSHPPTMSLTRISVRPRNSIKLKVSICDGWRRLKFDPPSGLKKSLSKTVKQRISWVRSLMRNCMLAFQWGLVPDTWDTWHFSWHVTNDTWWQSSYLTQPLSSAPEIPWRLHNRLECFLHRIEIKLYAKCVGTKKIEREHS